ncbi:MAG: hypothetical protein C5B50_06440 [Verrucomicrobia bacterium]|nr:MAG: hypothetical protein C5B50_06440 [Verrucomicrobiota bacterium]
MTFRLQAALTGTMLAGLQYASATTTITNTRPEIAWMASLWEADSIQISPLADAQYPQYGTSYWQYIFPHNNISSDGDIHNDMGLDSSGTGSTNNNAGESPIIAEVINATSSQLSYLGSESGHLEKTRGIFRFYTEHPAERHFELHPVTETYMNNAGSWVLDVNYRPNITTVPEGSSHATSTYQDLLNGTETMTAQVMADNTNVVLTYPSPSVNYVQYDGVALSGLLSDSVSLYFWFQPNLVPTATVRCRLLTNTPAATAATGLTTNMAVTVNALTRTDMLIVSNQVAALSANQSSTFMRPVEFITLSVTGPSGVPYLYVTPSGGISSTGLVGGPFTPSGQAFTLNNIGSSSLTWTATNAANWLSITPTAGTLAAGATTNVVATFNANASNLSSNSYSDVIAFANTSNGNGNLNVPVSLVVTGAPLQRIQTVFMILMENHNWSSILGSSSAPYINNTVLPMASHAEQYYNPPGLHPSLPNYLWLEAGTNFGITSDLLPASAHQNTTNHFVSLLARAGISWRSYQEDICGCNCPLSNTNLYVPRHEPMVYFDDITNTNNANSASCIANVRPYTQLAGDLSSNLVARYNFITPNLCDDMHNSSGCATTDEVKNGDTWLANNLPAILASAAYSNNGAVFITWDEAGSGDGPIGMIVLSPLAKAGGYSNNIPYSHSSTLRTLEEIFNVGPMLGDAANATDLSDLFSLAPGSVGQLAVSPATGLASTGPTGGPFAPSGQVYALTNSGAASLNWTATDTTNWLTLSPASGTLVVGASVSVTATINANANSLGAGNYSDTISFNNLSGGSGSTTRAASLTVTNSNVQSPPTVTTGGGSNLTTNSATLNGTVNPNGLATTAHFDYGLTPSYGSTAAVGGTLNGSTAQPVSAGISGLIAGTTYHFRLSATNSLGAANGMDQTFTTVSASAVVTTLAGWNVSGQTNYGPSPMAPTTNAANVTVAGLTRGSGIGTSGTAALRAWGGNTWTSSSSANAISANQFATFGISANSGYTVSFDSISEFDYRHSATGGTNGLLQYQVGSGGFNNVATFFYTNNTSSGAQLGPIDLSSISALQNVPAGTNVTFRIVNWGGTSSAGTWYIFDVLSNSAPDLAIKGTIAPVVITPPFITTFIVSNSNAIVTFSGSASDPASAFTLLSATNAPGPYLFASSNITQLSPGLFQVSVPAASSNQFFRVER